MHTNDVGVRLLVTLQEKDADGRTVVVDVSAATVRKICLQKPDLSVIEFDASFYTTGVDGKIYYDTLAADLDVAGSWKVAARVENTGVYNYRSTERVFTVKDSICP